LTTLLDLLVEFTLVNFIKEVFLMAKLGNFETPAGNKGNIFEISSWGGMILGAMVMILTFGIGEHFAKAIQGRVPATQVTQPWNTPAPVSNAPQKITL
jgi:hypothetical protein